MKLTVLESPPPPSVEAGPGLDPLEALARVAARLNGNAPDERDYVMLHSGPAAGYSVLGFEPVCRVVVGGDGAAIITGLGTESPIKAGGPLGILEEAVAAVEFAPPHMLVGWLGWVGYDIAGVLENVPRVAPDDLHWPLICFSLFRHYLVFDAAARQAMGYTLCAPHERAPAFPWELLQNASAPREAAGEARIVESQPRMAFENKVRRIKQYIASGDIYQANLAQRWKVYAPEPPEEVFRRLCAISPAPYATCVRMTDGTLVRHVMSASPELFLAVDESGGEAQRPGGGRVVTRPIKGTRPRDLHDPARDAALRDELLASAKDNAELTMIVDLLRNDLGRVAEYGSVRVRQARAMEQHPTVWHTVATIDAQLRRGVGVAELLAALCPGGSITGAPKIRAMQVIEELEGFRRGMYCGNIGAIGPGRVGNAVALNIAIRTIVQQEGHAYVYAGGGIVADSDPGREYEETLHKAAAMFRALRLTPPAP